MGTYVEKIGDPTFDWGVNAYPGTNMDANVLVKAAFEASLADAEAMMIRLVGSDGSSGSLGALLSSIDTVTAPDDISTAVQWSEVSHDTTLYSILINRLNDDLQNGATGLDPSVEAGIFNRALSRQNIEEDKAQTEIEEYFSSRGFDLPPLAMAARLQEQTNGRTLRTTDINGQIAKEQADLAQKNSQFVVATAGTLEAALREFTTKRNDRSLVFAKSVVENAIKLYAEQVVGYKVEIETRAKIAEAMANIAMQQIASARGSINVSAGINHGSGRSESESFTHTESRSIGIDLNNSLSEQHPYDPI